jgi:hypothetical protein
MASVISRTISGVKALSRSGRFSRTTRTPPERSLISISPTSWPSQSVLNPGGDTVRAHPIVNLAHAGPQPPVTERPADG